MLNINAVFAVPTSGSDAAIDVGDQFMVHLMVLRDPQSVFRRCTITFAATDYASIIDGPTLYYEELPPLSPVILRMQAKRAIKGSWKKVGYPGKPIFHYESVDPLEPCVRVTFDAWDDSGPFTLVRYANAQIVSPLPPRPADPEP